MDMPIEVIADQAIATSVAGTKKPDAPGGFRVPFQDAVGALAKELTPFGEAAKNIYGALGDEAKRQERERMTQTMGAAPVLPGELRGEFGGRYYGEDFGAKVRQQVEAGKITPAQGAQAVAKYREWLKTPEGLMVEQSRIEQRAAGDLANIGIQEQEAVAEQQRKLEEAYALAGQRSQEQQAEWNQIKSDYMNEQRRRMAEMEQLGEEIRSTKIDPSNYWSNQNGLSAALSVIGVALGAYASGRSGGRIPNAALEQLNRSIDRDIELQKVELQKKQGSLANLRGMYGLAEQRLGDQRAAIDYTRAMMKENLANQVQQFAASSGTQKAKLAANELAVKLRAEADLSKNRVRAVMANQARDAARRSAAARYVSPAEILKLEKQRADIEKTRAETMKLRAEGAEAEPIAEGVYRAKPDMVARYVPGLKGFVGSEKIATDLNEGITQAETAKSLIDEMMTLRGEGSTGAWGTDRAKYDALRAKALGSLNKAEKFGALDNGTTAVLSNELPEAEFFSWDAKAIAALQAAKDGIESSQDKVKKNVALVPGELVLTERGPGYRFSAAAAPRQQLNLRPTR